MKITSLIFLLSVVSMFAADPVYEVLKVEKFLNAQSQTEKILISVKVSIGSDSEEAKSYVRPSDVAAANTDKTKIEEYAVDLAAQLQKILENRISKTSKAAVDPATITIDPVKVENKKNQL